jgi:signal transduction histidine kinase/ActR/RegA family two-component response regulator
LLDPSAWREGLENYALATNLAVALADVNGQRLGELINPRPTWGMLHARASAGLPGCPFTLMSAGPCTCAVDALARGGLRLARDRAGLVHFAVPLFLDDHPLGALLAGQVFDQYPDEHALEHVALQLGLRSEDVWELARREHPVKQATLRVYARLLATLGETFVRTRSHTIGEAERLAEVTRLSAELGEANRRKDEFLAMLAHELRNPLAPIRNAAQVMRLLAKNEPDLRWAGEVVERQVQHLSRLVDDLLDVSRFATSKIDLRKEPTELAAVVARAIETSRPAIDGRRQELAVSLPPERLGVQADPVRLAQVLGNLLDNAAKYTPEGGHISLAVDREGNDAVLRVRDTGVGIAADMLPRVFDLFTQVRPTLDRAQGGLGIGLTLVRSLVEAHGGSVRAFSAGANGGSEFVVRLPLLPDFREREATGDQPRRGASPARCHILVVDDSVDAALSLAGLLEAMGHDVRTTHDGSGALEAARTYAPDVVVLDIGLPQMDGYEVARRLRSQPAMEHVLLLALTGYGREEDRRRCREAGFDHHLVKPVDPATLQELLATRAGAAKDASPASLVNGTFPTA